MKRDTDERWMKLALSEAESAFARGEVPVGAVVVKEGAVVGKGSNSVEMTSDPTAHAEVIAIGAAATTLGSKFLQGCTLYVTLEPCFMCAGAIVLARLEKVVFGALDPKSGALVSLARVAQDSRLNHQAEVSWGVMEKECSGLVNSFFKRVREAKTDSRVG